METARQFITATPITKPTIHMGHIMGINVEPPPDSRIAHFFEFGANDFDAVDGLDLVSRYKVYAEEVWAMDSPEVNSPNRGK